MVNRLMKKPEKVWSSFVFLFLWGCRESNFHFSLNCSFIHIKIITDYKKFKGQMLITPMQTFQLTLAKYTEL